MSPRLQAEDLFGTWIDDVSFETDGIGWDLINSLIGSCYPALGLPSLKSAVTWIFMKYRAEIERGIRVEPRRLRDMYHRALWAGRGDIVDIVANYFGLAQDHSSFNGFGPLERLIWRMIGEVEEVRIPGIVEAVQCLLRIGVNPHLAGREPYFSPHSETALSIAMYSPGAFWHLRNILRCLHIDPGNYFEEELCHASRLTELGWTKEGLLAVWNFDYSSSFFNERSTCRDCNTYFYFSWGKWWEEEVLQHAREQQEVQVHEDKSSEWILFDGWTAQLRDDYFKGWIQMKSSDAGSAYARMGLKTSGHDGSTMLLGRTLSNSSKDSRESRSSQAWNGLQTNRTPSSSSNESSNNPARRVDAAADIAVRTPSHTESELDDASQRGNDDTDAEPEQFTTSDDGRSDLVYVSSLPMVWWRCRTDEEQRCPVCRAEYMARQKSRQEEGFDIGTHHMPGAFPS